MAGRLFAGYELVGRIARGGMGEIFVARRFGGMRFEKLVAVKQILPSFSRSSEYVEMFGAEARTLAGLTHPGVVQVLDCGFAEGCLYLVMEYVHGETLARLIERVGETGAGMAPAMVAFVGAHVARALHHAHEARGAHGRPLGLVHGDVSPANVLIGYDGAIKLIDFGVAWVNGCPPDGKLRGNPCYLAPEVLGGAAADRRADMFALGAVLWEMALGRRLFDCVDFGALRETQSQPIPAPRQVARGLPVELDALIMSLLARNPAQRPASGLDVARRLDRIARKQPPFDEALLAEAMGTRFKVERTYRDRMLELALSTTFQDYLVAERMELSQGYEGLRSSRPVATQSTTAPISVPVKVDPEPAR